MKNIYSIFTILIIIITFSTTYSQNVGINSDGSDPDASAMLDVKSTTKGLLMPRMTTAQRTSIASPANGLIVFDTDANAFYYYNGSDWAEIKDAKGIEDDDKNTKVYVTSSSDSLYFMIAGEIRMTIDPNGIVEIVDGTAPSDSQLRINSGTGQESSLTLNSGTSGLRISTSDTQAGDLNINNANATDDTRMIINSGTGQESSLTLNSGTSGLRISTNDTNLDTLTVSNISTTSPTRMLINSGTGQESSLTLRSGNTENYSVVVDGTNLAVAVNGTDALVVEPAGNVGIGLANPDGTYALDVSGAIHSSDVIRSGNSIIIDGVNYQITTDSHIAFRINTTEYMRLASTGDIGIGTSAPSPSSILDITSTSKGLLIPRMTTVQRTAIVSPALGLLVFDTNVNAFFYYNGTAWTNITNSIPPAGANNQIQFNNSGAFGANSNLVWDNTNSRLGIGTSTPDASSVVDITSTNKGILIPRMTSSIRDGIGTPATGLLIYQTDNTPGFYYYDGSAWQNVAGNPSWNLSGNVGTTNGTDFIGTTDAQSLDIRTNNIIRTRITQKGQIETLNTGQSVFVGEGAGANDDITTNYNVFVGYQAGQANVSGLSNTFVGFQAGKANTANSNTFIGNSAGALNTNGSNNVMMGYLTGWNNSNGGFNTFIGKSAAENNSTGSKNTILGYSSFLSNVAGSNATAVGYNAMLNTNNTATPFTNTNVALGYEALRGSVLPSSNTGNYNTALGYQTLYETTTGGNNTAVGYLAGYTTTSTNAVNSGSNNTFLGYNTGFSSSTQRTNATAIGYNAKVNADNSLILGGTGADAVKVGIGTEIPTAFLDLSSATPTNASLRLRASASSPTTPNNGDLWWDGSSLNFYNGSSTVNLLGFSNLSGTGTDKYIARWGAGNTLTNSIIQDDGISLGIGITPVASIKFNIAATGTEKGFQVNSSGTNSAAFVYNSNTSNSVYAFLARTDGTGNAGEFQINNATNASNAISATTNGTGQAASFTITNAGNSAAAIYAASSGTGPSISAYKTATGNCSNFIINNATNASDAIYAQTNGTGKAINAFTTGTAIAGLFTINNASSSANALSASTDGSGAAIYGTQTNTTGTTYGVKGNSNSSSGVGVYGTGGMTGIEGYVGGTGSSYGGRFSNASSSASPVYGVYSLVNGTSTNSKYGFWGFVASSGVTNYGTYSESFGATTNYGVYAKSVGAGTTNYGLYSTASGASNNIAAFFDQGNVGIGINSPAERLDLNGNFRISSATGEINRTTNGTDKTGNANLLPIGYAVTDRTGSALTKTSNITISRTGLGTYQVAFSDYNNFSTTLPVAMVSILDDGGGESRGIIHWTLFNGNTLLISTFDTTGTASDRGFSIQVFTP